MNDAAKNNVQSMLNLAEIYSSDNNVLRNELTVGGK
jgi:hypothetical protein